MKDESDPSPGQHADPPEQPGGIDALNARLARDLSLLRLPAAQWTAPATGPDGAPMFDLLIVGAGMYGLAAAGRLWLRGVRNIRLLDRAAAGTEGPWLTWARMPTLRSPKELPGTSFGIPSLSFRSWYEARFGTAAWDALYKIPNPSWQAYLGWVRERLALPIENHCSVDRLTCTGRHVRVDCADGRALFARRVIVATGRAGAGGFNRPDTISASLWPDLAAHTCEPIDFGALAGRQLAVIGAGASAWDNAATALEAGAASVTMFCRRAALPQINKGRANANPGFFEGWAALDDAQRWALAWYLERIQAPPPHETVLRTIAHRGFSIRFGTPVASAERGAGRVCITLASGERHACDFLILGTGFRNDLSREPMFGDIAARLRRWQDAYTPPADKPSPTLGLMPYLGQGFELQARDRAIDPALARIHLFNAAAFMSFGTLSLDMPSLDIAGERIAAHVCRHLFREDFGAIFAGLQAWEAEHELEPTPFHSPQWVNRLP